MSARADGSYNRYSFSCRCDAGKDGSNGLNFWDRLKAGSGIKPLLGDEPGLSVEWNVAPPGAVSFQ